MSFELVDGKLTFSHDAAEALRLEWKRDPMVKNKLLQATGNDRAWTDAILNGPKDNEITFLKENPQNVEAQQAFDKVYGTGASQYYSQPTFGDKAGEVLPATVGGVQDFIGNTYNTLAQTFENTDLGRMADFDVEATARSLALSRESGGAENTGLMDIWFANPNVTPQDYEDAFKLFEDSRRKQTATWTDDRREERLGVILKELSYIEEVRPNSDFASRDQFAGMTPEELERHKRFLRTEAAILTEEVKPEEERYLDRLEQTRTTGANIMAELPFINGMVEGEDIRADRAKNMPGQLVEGISAFAASFAGPAAMLGKITGAGRAAQFAAGTVAGMWADATAFDPEDPQFVDFIDNVFGTEVKSALPEFLVKQDDDSDAEKRLKAALEGAGVGAALSGLFMVAAKGWKSLKRGEITQEQLTAQMEAKLKEEADKFQQEQDAAFDAEQNNPLAREASEFQNRPAEPLSALEREAAGFKPEAPAPSALEAEAQAFKPEADPTVEGVFGKQEPKPADPEPLEKAVEDAINGGPNDGLANAAERLGNPRPINGVRQVETVVRQIKAKMDEWTSGVMEDLYTMARETIESNRTIFNETRNHRVAADAAAPHVKVIMDFVRSGQVSKAIDYATQAVEPAVLKDKSFAFQSVAVTFRKAVDKSLKYLDELEAGKGTPPELIQAAQKSLDNLLEVYFRLEATNTNFGSLAGALLQQRQATIVAKEGVLSGKVRKPKAETVADDAAQVELIEQAVENANLRGQQANDFWNWYKGLVKGGAKPSDAWRLVGEYMNAATRENIPFKADPKAPSAKELAKMESEASISMKAVDHIIKTLYSARLSGLTTHIINNLSSGLRMTQHFVGEGIAALVKLDPYAGRMLGDRLTGIRDGFKMNLKMTWEALKMGRAPLSDDPGMADFKGANGATGFVAEMVGGGGVVPSLRLLAMSDQFFSGNMYNGWLGVKAGREADILGLKGEARKAYIRKEIAKGYDPNGRGIYELGVHAAKDVTFQQTLNRKSPYAMERGAAKLVNLINSAGGNPALKLVMNLHFPFMRVAYLLADRGVRLSPALNVPLQIIKRGATGNNLRFYDDLFGKNGLENQHRAVGEFTLGTAFTGAFAALYASGDITGGYTEHWGMDPITGKVKPKYSIRVGDQWVSYERFEPYAAPFKYLANAMEAMLNYNAAAEREEFESYMDQVAAIFAGAGFVIGEQINSMSVLTGTEDLIKLFESAGPEGEFSAVERYAQNLVTGFVPNSHRQLNRFMNDGEQSYGHDLLDKLAAHYTWMSKDNFNLDYKRDPVTGEIMQDPKKGIILLPTDNSYFESDPVARMINEAYNATGKTFVLKNPKQFPDVKPGLDLRGVKADDGKRSLYDFYLGTVASIQGNEIIAGLDIRGKTYREALTMLAENPHFMSLPWGNRTRVKENEKSKLIQALKTHYEGLALEELRKQDAYRKLAVDQLAAEDRFSATK